MSFTQFSLHQRLLSALEKANYTTPTPIQTAALPLALAGKDLIGTAQTGTGKTAVFVLPLLQRLHNIPTEKRPPRALILTPTRELAEQIHDTIRQLGCHTNVRSATVYGGVGMTPQERALRNGTEIIVACPGRLLDHVARGNVDFSRIECLVLDEADRMLDMGFLPSVKRIIGMLPSPRQTMLFSATFAPELNAFVDATLQNPQRVGVSLAAPAETVTHVLYPVPKHLKTALLIEVLSQLTRESVLIFTRTKHRANRIAEQLSRAGHATDVLHSNKSQTHRQKALAQFRSGEVQVLVATDIAARGIDVASISHVINYDIPDCADTYIHRIGRTGRAERSGEALTFVTMEDGATLQEIERALGERIATRMVDSFNYKQPAPKTDEFQRPPLPPRRPSAAADRPVRQDATSISQKKQQTKPSVPVAASSRRQGERPARASASRGVPTAKRASRRG